MANTHKRPPRPARGRGLFYTRDSLGASEMAPSGYVKWAAATAQQDGVNFRGTGDQIDRMRRDRLSAEGDVFQDLIVKGNVLDRPGLNALFAEAERDRSVTHVYIPRRDRLARPDEIVEGILLELRICQDLGLTLVYGDRRLSPVKPGQKFPVEEFLVSGIQYHQAEQFRRELAGKIVTAQIALAEKGLSTGGRAAYGLRRALVLPDGSVVRYLEDGERVKAKGQHVVWLPDEGDVRWQTRLRILQLLPTQRAGAIARLLNREGIPSPDAGRTRTDRGHTHPVSGQWTAAVVTSIGRDPRNVSLAEYGRRSMGEKARFSPDGPRPLDDRDFGGPDGGRRVIVNPASQRVRSSVLTKPAMTEEAFVQLQRTLDERGGTQRGKPRSRKPDENPLGARIYDADCGWPMYRTTSHGVFRYLCGQYTQSHGGACRCNHVNGATATQFVLSCLRQRLLYPDLLPRLERRLRELAAREHADDGPARAVSALRAELSRVRADLAAAAHNMTVAKKDEHRQAMATVFDELSARERSLKERLAEAEHATTKVQDAEAEVSAAMAVAARLVDLAGSTPTTLAAAGQLFAAVDARLYLRFTDDPRGGKRVLRVPAGGMLTFGNDPPPIELYKGPTDRASVRAGCDRPGAVVASGEKSDSSSGSEGDSVGNARRGTPRRSVGTPAETTIA